MRPEQMYSLCSVNRVSVCWRSTGRRSGKESVKKQQIPGQKRDQWLGDRPLSPSPPPPSRSLFFDYLKSDSEIPLRTRSVRFQDRPLCRRVSFDPIGCVSYVAGSFILRGSMNRIDFTARRPANATTGSIAEIQILESCLCMCIHTYTHTHMYIYT